MRKQIQKLKFYLNVHLDKSCEVRIQLRIGCMAQLVERLLPIPEVRGSNPVIGKNLYIY